MKGFRGFRFRVENKSYGSGFGVYNPVPGFVGFGVEYLKGQGA